MALSAIPYYMLGLVLLYLLAIACPDLPALRWLFDWRRSRVSTLPFVLDILRHAFLPGLSIVLAVVGFWALGMRGMMITDEGRGLHHLRRGERAARPAASSSSTHPQRDPAPGDRLRHLARHDRLRRRCWSRSIFGYPGIGSLLFNAISGLGLLPHLRYRLHDHPGHRPRRRP